MSKITIEDVAEQFDLWRTTRSGHLKTPARLLELVCQLIPLYPKRQIINTLKIGHRLLNSLQSCKTQSQPQPLPEHQPQFHDDQIHFTSIKLLDIDNSLLTEHKCQISKNGATLLITTTSPETIIKHFLCYS